MRNKHRAGSARGKPFFQTLETDNQKPAAHPKARLSKRKRQIPKLEQGLGKLREKSYIFQCIGLGSYPAKRMAMPKGGIGELS
jgi:hypothetical protein